MRWDHRSDDDHWPATGRFVPQKIPAQRQVLFENAAR
jgi:hypothetical protein